MPRTGGEPLRTKRSSWTKRHSNISHFVFSESLLRLMSTPINALRNLNLGGMPETRSQTQQGQRRGASASTSRGRGRGRGGRISQSPFEPDTPVRGHSGLLYNTQDLSPGTSQRATEGLISEFYVDRLQRHESAHDSYYAFQLKKPISVRIHNPDLGGSKVECTCDEYQQLQSACVHIYVSLQHPSGPILYLAN